jgi:hypothetical protein
MASTAARDGWIWVPPENHVQARRQGGQDVPSEASSPAEALAEG